MSQAPRSGCSAVPDGLNTRASSRVSHSSSRGVSARWGRWQPWRTCRAAIGPRSGTGPLGSVAGYFHESVLNISSALSPLSCQRGWFIAGECAAWRVHPSGQCQWREALWGVWFGGAGTNWAGGWSRCHGGPGSHFRLGWHVLGAPGQPCQRPTRNTMPAVFCPFIPSQPPESQSPKSQHPQSQHPQQQPAPRVATPQTELPGLKIHPCLPDVTPTTHHHPASPQCSMQSPHPHLHTSCGQCMRLPGQCPAAEN